MSCDVPFTISDIWPGQATSAAYVLSCGLESGHADPHIAFGEVELPGQQTEWRFEWSTLVSGN